MNERDHPKVTIDEDVLDLRDPQTKSLIKRPSRAQSRNISSMKKSSVQTEKKGFPNLHRLLNSYNQKRARKTFFETTKTQPAIDNRFRKKLVKVVPSAHTDSELDYEESVQKLEENHIQGSNDAESSSDEENEDENSPPKTPVRVSLVRKHFENLSKTKLQNDKIRPNVPKKRITENPTNKMDENDGELFEMMSEECAKLQPLSVRSLPSFKKSWTVPSLELLKREEIWTKNYNALCAKYDRKTYEFDSETNSLDSLDQITSYSSLFKSNYMNLIFCLGCLCGLLLVAGLLTAAEIRQDLFQAQKEAKSVLNVGIFGFILHQIFYPIRVLYYSANCVYNFIDTFTFGEENPMKFWEIF